MIAIEVSRLRGFEVAGWSSTTSEPRNPETPKPEGRADV